MKPNKIDFLLGLPPEVTETILGLLDLCSLCKASQVSADWQDFVNNCNRIWKHFCYQYCLETDITKDREAGYTWKDVLKKNYRKREIQQQWMNGEFSKPKSFTELPSNHMWPMDADSWGDIFDKEMSR